MKEQNYVVTITRTFEAEVGAVDKTQAEERAKDAITAGGGTQIDEYIDVLGPDDI